MNQRDIFPPDLLAIFESLDYEESGGMVISSLDYTDTDLKVKFTLTKDDCQTSPQLWQLDVIDIKKERFVRNWTTYPEIYTDHFLLYEFIDNYIELYFNGSTQNPEKLLADLYDSHISNYSNALAFGLGINAPDGMLRLCTSESRLFTRGPKRILAKYAECLKINGIETNFIGEIESDQAGLKLLIFGESYFIGRDFKFSLV